MPSLAHFDCFSGISGDMTLAALLDAGLPLDHLTSELRKLNLPGWSLSSDVIKKSGFRATSVKISADDQKDHRHLSAILKMISSAGLSPRAADLASRIFTRLGKAEARVHNSAIEKVHFHEVGAVDSILDIVGAAIGFDALGITEFSSSPLNLGSGRVQTAHGLLPVPAPATAELLKNAPTYASPIERELVTPTGAAIIATLVTHFGPQPPMNVRAIGYGAGTADLPQQPNLLRLFLGERTAPRPADSSAPDSIIVLESNLDDMNPQLYGHFAELALAAGALDVFATPVFMKKNRPAFLITVLAPPAAAAALTDLFFRETTTIGVRSTPASRAVLDREIVTVATSYGPVRVKVARRNGAILNFSPEFDDCRRLALEHNVPLKQVLAQASLAFSSSPSIKS